MSEGADSASPVSETYYDIVDPDYPASVDGEAVVPAFFEDQNPATMFQM